MGFFNFIKKVAQGDEKPGGGVFGFLDNARKNPVQTYVNAQKASRDIVVGAARGVYRVPETVVRSFIEASPVGDAHRIASNRLDQLQTQLDSIPDTDPRKAILQKSIAQEKSNLGFDSSSPTDPIRRILYGSEPVQTYQTRGAGIEKATGIPAPIAGVGLLGLDIFPGGKGAKITEELAKAGTAKQVTRILSDQLPKEVVDRVAPALAKTKDPNIIQNILDRGMGREPSTIVKPPSAELPPQAQQVSPMQEVDPFKDILGAVNGEGGARSARVEQNTVLSQERGARFQAGAQASQGAEGSDAYFKRLGALKGEYSKVNFKPLMGDIGPDKAEQLFTNAQRKIYQTPDDVYREIGLHPDGARLSTERAVRKVLGLEPGLPTSSELKLLDLYSPKLAQQVKDSLPVGRKIFNAASVLFGNVRSLKSSVDLSMGGRQGLFVAGRHPGLWKDANVESLKYAKSDRYYKDQMQALASDEWGAGGDKYGLALTGANSHEEAFAATDVLASKTAKKLGVGHLVAGSERAYTGGLTKLRHDLWQTRLQAYGNSFQEAENAIGKDGMRGLAEAINTLTGRGGKAGGFIAKHANTLQEALFSPRLWASRLQPFNPAFWKRIGPAGRAEAVQSLGSFAAVAGVVLGAAVAAGAKVETDPRSSDFLKIKVGDTRYDVLGGLQQNLVFFARELSNSTKSSQSGRVTKFGEGFGSPTRLSALFDMLRNKSNPVLGSAANILEGKDKAGNKINPLIEIGQLFVPISIQGSVQSVKEEGSVAKGLAKNVPDIFGVGTQTYSLKDIKLSDTQQKFVDNLKSKGAPDQQIEATQRFYQTQKTGPDRDKASSDIKAALQAGDVQKATSIAKEYNKKYQENLYDWSRQYRNYLNDEQLVKDYQSKLITSKSFDRWIADIKQGGQ